MRVSVCSSFTSALLVSALAAPLEAQTTTSALPSPIALALAGCWEPASGDLTGLTTCIVLENDASVLRVISLGLGKEAVESRLRLDGERWPVAAEGCQGWQQAQVSSDGERILIAGEMRCGTLPAQRRSATFLITPRAEWLRAEGRGMASVGAAQIQLMRPVGTFAGVGGDIRDAVFPLLVEAEQERARLQRARLTGGDLLELEARGAATSIIDVVVAAGNPQAFAVSTVAEPIVAVAPTEEVDPNWLYRPAYGYPLGYGYPYLSYNDYAYLSSWWPGYFPSGGVVVINPIDRPQSGGQVVRGQGYRNTRAGSTTGNAPVRSVSPSARPSSSSGARTAKPRSP